MLFLIVLVNVVVFAAVSADTGTLSPSAEQLLGWGGDLGELSLHGEPWRLVSAMFLHVGIEHIAGNMLLLVIAGRILERTIGPVWFFVVYGLCGVAASIASAIGHPDVVGVGASGAIAGIMGVLVTLYVSGRHTGVRGSWLLQVLAINVAYSFAPNVDWLAHAGGFVAGAVCGVVLLIRAPATD